MKPVITWVLAHPETTAGLFIVVCIVILSFSLHWAVKERDP